MNSGSTVASFIEESGGLAEWRRTACMSDTGRILRFCRERMAGYKAPKLVEIVDQLPKNASGKILKRELRDRFADKGKSLGT